MVWTGALPSAAWVVVALVVIAVIIGLGSGVMAPRMARIAAMLAEGRKAEAAGMARGVLRLAKIDYAIHFGVVTLMVLEPGWGDAAVLGGLGAVVASGLAFLLRPEERRVPRAA